VNVESKDRMESLEIKVLLEHLVLPVQLDLVENLELRVTKVQTDQKDNMALADQKDNLEIMQKTARVDQTV